MSNLPEEMLLEIFSRIPKRSLLRFRCVSKSFCELFATPSFQNMHHELSNIKNGTRIVFRVTECKKKYTIDYSTIQSLLPLSTSSETKYECEPWDFPSIFQEYKKRTFWICSYNGLVWIRHITSSCEKLCIVNLLTNRHKNIPAMAREVNNDDISAYGFGYDFKTDDYKLVRVVYNLASKCSDVDVYTLGINSWKSTESIPYYVYYRNLVVEGVFFNGALHWLVCTFEQGLIVLVCFDIVNERFEEVALPDSLTAYHEKPSEEDTFYTEVTVLGVCLSLVVHVPNVRVDVWVMQEHGVRESWTKSFSITLESIASSTKLELIWSFKNNEILWMVDHGFVLYDPKNKRYRKLMLTSRITSRLHIRQHNDMISSVLLN